MIWVLIVLLAPILGLYVAWRLWPPTKNVDREAFGHWIESLMRFYEDGSALVIADRDRQANIRCIRSDSEGTACYVKLVVGRTPVSERHIESLRSACEKESDVVIPGAADSAELPSTVINVKNIWATGAGARCSRVAQQLLSAMEIPSESRFDLFFEGKRSLERTLEARKRQKERRRQEG